MPFKLIGVLVLLSFLAIIVFYMNPKLQTSLKHSDPISKTTISPKPSPFLFQELTIPYLRDKEYKSTLGELQKISDNGVYASYLTNYSSDNLKINGLLTIPDSDKPTGGYPAIVFVHGYIPPNQYQTLERYV